MVLVVVIGYVVCGLGLKKGVENAAKFMMGGLFVVLVVLAVRAVTLPGAGAGLDFYLKPDFAKLSWSGVYAAMSQSFFTLSLGIGSMAIFGSYISKQRALAGESVRIIGIDTFVALMAGLIIFATAARVRRRPRCRTRTRVHHPAEHLQRDGGWPGVGGPVLPAACVCGDDDCCRGVREPYCVRDGPVGLEPKEGCGRGRHRGNRAVHAVRARLQPVERVPAAG